MSAPRVVVRLYIVTKLSASHRCVRTSEGVDLSPLRAMSIAVEASAADVPDNRPLSRSGQPVAATASRPRLSGPGSRHGAESPPVGYFCGQCHGPERGP